MLARTLSELFGVQPVLTLFFEEKCEMITVFYDDQCGLCRKEIAVYQNQDKHGLFNWQRLSETTFDPNEQRFDLVQALERLHVINHQGDVKIGVDAFIVIWNQLPYWKFLGFFASVAPVKWFLNLVYDQFAKRRFKRLDHCQLALAEQMKKQT